MGVRSRAGERSPVRFGKGDLWDETEGLLRQFRGRLYGVAPLRGQYYTCLAINTIGQSGTDFGVGVHWAGSSFKTLIRASNLSRRGWVSCNA